jgi:hypothetical protein
MIAQLEHSVFLHQNPLLLDLQCSESGPKGVLPSCSLSIAVFVNGIVYASLAADFS